MRFFFLIAAILLCGGITAAESGAPEPSPRVVSLSPALTELVYRLGGGAFLVGRSDACDFPPEVRRIPVAGRFAAPDVERVLRLKPTLLITNDLINPGQIGVFRKAGIEVEFMTCRNFAEYRDCVTTLGRRLGCQEAAGHEIERIDRFLAEQARQNEGASPRDILYVVWDAPLMVAGPGSWPDELIRLAGGRNVASGAGAAYFKCSLEWLLAQRPEVIVWCGSPEGWKRQRFWNRLEAVRERRVIADLDSDLIQRPGPRAVDGVRLLRKRLAELP